ncbi:hypothetical protein [Nostoc cycadae]|uniref:WD-40 repeat protein n=1 Tax=Nostoc cycadae WK-1 TaxID=1861711 RepID=A0A2H6LMM4_9NOSO|nr:hypothetical protein [Nostoc cycadae]GBE94465.1 WD-40 repeat protein [Nostoc cycadae WK-1]
MLTKTAVSMNEKPRDNQTHISGGVQGVVGENQGTVIINETHNRYYGNDPEEEPLREFKEEKLPRSPYKGLARFEPEDSDRFYGRKKLIQDLTNYLEENHILFILGASGSGKSSLVQAGIIPEICGKGKYLFKLCFVPDKDPFNSFASKIGIFLSDNREEYEEAEEQIKQLVEQMSIYPEGKIIVKIIEEIKKNNDGFGLIFIDQFEEIFTQTQEEKRSKFIENLVNLIDIQNHKVKIILAMRNDFYSHLGAYSDFLSITQSHIRNVLDMTDRELRLVIKNPAARHGVKVEEDLIAQIIKDFWGQSQTSLTLLQYTLDLLWRTELDKKDLLDGELNQKTYINLGGVGGALQKEAERIYEKITKDKDEKNKQVKAEKVEQIFIKLVTITSDDIPVSKRESKASFDDEEIKIINKLINNGLLVSGHSNDPHLRDTIEIAHEALIKYWSKLQDWIQKHKEILILKRQLIEAAKIWYRVKNDENQENNKDKAISELWTGYKLNQVLELKENNTIKQLDKATEDFIQASIKYSDHLKREQVEQVITTYTAYSQTLFISNKRLDALVKLVEAGKLLQKTPEISTEIKFRFLITFGQIFNEVAEFNSFDEHQDHVSSVTYSLDNQIIASASYDNTIKLWKRDGNLIQTLDGHDGHQKYVTDVSFSPDGKILASASTDNTIKLWEKETITQEWKLLKTFDKHKHGVLTISFSPDGKIIASGSIDKTVKLWSKMGKVLKTLKGHEDEVIDVTFSPNGQIVASTSKDKTVKLWTRKGEFIKNLEQLHKNYVSSLSFSPTDKTLVTGSLDDTFIIWSVDEKSYEIGQHIEVFKAYQEGIKYIAFSPDGEKIVSAGQNGTIKVWQKDGTFYKTLKGHENVVKKVRFSPDSSTLVSCSQDENVKLWHCKDKFKGHSKVISNLNFSLDGKKIVTSEDRTINLWNCHGQLLQVCDFDNCGVDIIDAKFSQNGQVIAIAKQNGNIEIWNINNNFSNQFEYHKDFPIHKNAIKSIDFNYKNKMIVSASTDGTIKLWNYSNSNIYLEETSNVDIVIFSPDGTMLASINKNNRYVQLWHIKDKFNSIFSLEGVECIDVIFSNDNKLIATNCIDKIQIWNVNGDFPQTLQGKSKNKILSISFSPDNTLIASIRADQSVEIWSIKGKLLHSIQGNNKEQIIYCAKFSLNWNSIAVAGIENGYPFMNLWKLNLDEILLDSSQHIHDYKENNKYT